MRGKKMLWAVQRVSFNAYIIISTFTVVVGILTAPLLTRLFFNDWRFWRHWKNGFRLLIHAFSTFPKLIKWENNGFMFNVPWSAQPLTSPDQRHAFIRSSWAHGTSCGPCAKCCEKISCPLVDPKTTLCLAYDSFFWRYFNCGRFPTTMSELAYYDCEKWDLFPHPAKPTPARPAPTGEEVWLPK